MKQKMEIGEIQKDTANDINAALELRKIYGGAWSAEDVAVARAAKNVRESGRPYVVMDSAMAVIPKEIFDQIAEQLKSQDEKIKEMGADLTWYKLKLAEKRRKEVKHG